LLTDSEHPEFTMGAVLQARLVVSIRATQDARTIE
jgi:hypothetical protein